MCTSLNINLYIHQPHLISTHHSVKDILGYDPKDLCAEGVSMKDFVHPADQILMKRRPKVECCKCMYQFNIHVQL